MGKRLSVITCTKKKTDNLFKFRDYISYTTSGLVSVIEPIKISLNNDVDGWGANEELDTDLLKFLPYVQGKLQASAIVLLAFVEAVALFAVVVSLIK